MVTKNTVAKQTVEPYDYQTLYKLTSLSQPITIGAKTIVVASRPNKENNSYDSQVIAINKLTQEITPLSAAEKLNTAIQLSPNKSKLAYLTTASKNGQAQLAVINLNGGHNQIITALDEGVSSFLWGSDSNSFYITCSSKRNDGQSKECSSTSTITKKVNSATSSNDSSDHKNDSKKESPTTSADFPHLNRYQKLLYKIDGVGVLPQEHDYFIKKITLPTETQLVFQSDRDNHLQIETLYSQESSFSLDYVSHDESFFLLGDDLDPDDETSFGNTVYYYNTKDKKKTSLTTSLPKGSFAFGDINDSEDDILLVGNDFKYQFVSLNRIYRYHLETKELTPLTDSDKEVVDTVAADFQQQTDGKVVTFIDDSHFIYTTSETGLVNLYLGNLEGKNEMVINDHGHITGFSAQLVDGNSDTTDTADTADTADKTDKTHKIHSANKTLQIDYTYSNQTTPSQLKHYRGDPTRLVTVFDPNETVLEHQLLSHSEHFHYSGADDWSIEGWYLPPVTLSTTEETNEIDESDDKQTKHPAILYIHGGPQVNYGESYFHEMQSLAHKGYGVILLNPRGGNSYGQEFVKAILGDYGHKDYEDLMLGVDAVLEKHPEINQNELHVMGGSYGGFMTNWIVGHTNRFKRAITQRSISNWISFYGTSDVGSFFVEYQLQHDLEDYEELYRMSPIKYVANIKTPTLVMHSLNDYRCPIEQGEQFFTSLKRHNVETELITFPQSSHGLSRNGLPNLRVERFHEIIEWLQK